MTDNIIGEWEHFEVKAFSDGSVAVFRLRDDMPAIRLLPNIGQQTHDHTNLVQGNGRCRDTCTPEEYWEYGRIFDFLCGLQRRSFDMDQRMVVPRQ